MPGSHIQNGGSDGERSLKISALSPRHGGEMLWKKESQFFVDSVFSRAGKKQSPQKVGTLFFSQHFPLMSGTLFLSELKFLDSSLRYQTFKKPVDPWIYLGANILNFYFASFLPWFKMTKKIVRECMNKFHETMCYAQWFIIKRYPHSPFLCVVSAI